MLRCLALLCRMGLVSSLLLISTMAWSAMSISPSTSYTGSFTVSWGYVYPSNATKLQVSVNGGSWTDVQSVSGDSSLSFSGKSAKTYKYRVYTCSGGRRTPLVCSVAQGPATVVVKKPQVPGSLSVPATDIDGAYTVSWGASSGSGTTYTLQEQANAGSWVTVQTSAARSKAFSGKLNSDYSYRVKACNNPGCSAYSSAKNIRVEPGVPGLITGPDSDVDGTFSLSWSASAGSVDTYKLEQKLDDGAWSVIQDSSARTKAISVAGNGGIPTARKLAAMRFAAATPR